MIGYVVVPPLVHRLFLSLARDSSLSSSAPPSYSAHLLYYGNLTPEGKMASSSKPAQGPFHYHFGDCLCVGFCHALWRYTGVESDIRISELRDEWEGLEDI